MTLILKNDEIESLLSMQQLVDDTDAAFKDLGNGLAYNLPRGRIFIPVEEGGGRDAVCMFNNIAGAVPRLNAVALRIDLSIKHGVERSGHKTIQHTGDYTGLILLFDPVSRELVSIMDDEFVSWMRVGATSAVAARHLARGDSKVLGLFGSGEQARGQVMGMASVFNLDEIRVFSPTRAHREEFAAQTKKVLGVDCRPVDNPEDAVRGSDIVSLATNTVDPVFFGRWAEKGMHICSITNGDIHNRRTEVDEDTVLRSDVVVVNTRKQVELDHQGAIYSAMKSGRLKEAQVVELGEVVSGRAKGRRGRDDITLYANNHGMGLQFAVAARRIYEKAKAEGVGRPIDTKLFTTARSGGA